ncbi:MAG: hypothetical protein ACE5NG_14090 [bacterium]
MVRQSGFDEIKCEHGGYQSEPGLGFALTQIHLRLISDTLETVGDFLRGKR